MLVTTREKRVSEMPGHSCEGNIKKVFKKYSTRVWSDFKWSGIRTDEKGNEDDRLLGCDAVKTGTELPDYAASEPRRQQTAELAL
jgi:hypothetical protein